MKRFYKTAAPAEAETPAGAWTVQLDGRPVRTPAGTHVALPTRQAAVLLAAEWETQGDTIRPDAMPLTRLVNVALDRTPAVREGVAEQFAKYGETDVLCHLAEAPAALQARQTEQWAPLLDWAADALGVRLSAVCGITPGDQQPESLDRLRALALEKDDVGLTALAHAAAELGSAVLALAVDRGRLDADEAWRLSALDALWQQEQWGVDAEAEARAETSRAEVRAVAALLHALPG